MEKAAKGDLIASQGPAHLSPRSFPIPSSCLRKFRFSPGIQLLQAKPTFPPTYPQAKEPRVHRQPPGHPADALYIPSWAALPAPKQPVSALRKLPERGAKETGLASSKCPLAGTKLCEGVHGHRQQDTTAPGVPVCGIRLIGACQKQGLSIPTQAF